MRFIPGIANNLKIKGIRKADGELVIDAEINSEFETVRLKEFMTQAQINKTEILLSQVFYEILPTLAERLTKETHG
jgi:fructose-specific phosphotransferase system component IIB